MKNIIKIIGIAAVLGAGAFVGYKYIQKRNGTSPLPDDTQTNTPLPEYTEPTNTFANDNFPLKRGSKGNRVLALQQYLHAILPNMLTLNDISTGGMNFGNKTEAALISATGESEVSEVFYAQIMDDKKKGRWK